jgi:hypothetical protein
MSENEKLLSNIIKFVEYFKNNDSINNIYINILDDIKMIYTDKINNNLHHSNELIDYILHNIEFIIINKDYKLISYLTKNKNLDEKTKNIISQNWNDCKIFKNYIGTYVVFFIYNNIKYYCIKYKICYYDKSIMQQFAQNIFDNYENKPIHKIIISQRLKHIISYDEKFSIVNNSIYDQEKSQIYFSCFDELDFEHNENMKKMETNKKLFNAGYLIEYNNSKYLLNNKIYEKINNLLPKFTNINKIYFDLYKSDNLNFVINYLSLYPSDIIKRINLSFKTLSKEYLNIYHLTRKKAHPEIYEKLDETNKKILYDLHTIFIETRKNEYIVNNEIADKKSLTVDTVYKYFKKIDIDIIEKIYLNRNVLIQIIKDVFNNNDFKIFFDDCINTKTISYLLNKNY